jgi:hypothetical protein
MFLRMPEFISGLTHEAVSVLYRSEALAIKLAQLPRSSLISVVVNNPDMLARLPKDRVECQQTV